MCNTCIGSFLLIPPPPPHSKRGNFNDYVPNDINANDINANDINANDINANNIKINKFPENIKQLNASDWLKIEIQPCVIFSLALNHCYSQYVGT